MRSVLEKNFNVELMLEFLMGFYIAVVGLSFLTLTVTALLSLITFSLLMELLLFLNVSYRKGMRHLCKLVGYIVHS